MKDNIVAYILVLIGLSLSVFFLGGIYIHSFMPMVVIFFLSFISLFFPFASPAKTKENFLRIFGYRGTYFIFGLLLLSLLQLQNPSVEYLKSYGSWTWIELDYNSYLPSCVLAPEEKGSSELFYVLCGCAFLFGSIRCSFISRERVYGAFKVIFILCLIGAIIFCIQQVLGVRLYRWTSLGFRSSLSFVYHPHGNVFFMVAMAMGASLCAYEFSLLKRLLYFVGISFLLFAIYLSGGTGGSIMGTLLYFAILFILSKRIALRYILMLICFTGLFVGSIVFFRGFDKIDHNIEQTLEKISDISEPKRGRSLMKNITVDMIKSGGDYNNFKNKQGTTFANVVFGRGLNSYRSLCELYSINYERLNKQNVLSKKVSGFAHCDPLQFVFELGLIGVLLILGWLGYFIYKLIQAIVGGYWLYTLTPIVLCVFIVVLYSWNDYVLYNSFVAFMMIFLSVITLNLLELNKENYYA